MRAKESPRNEPRKRRPRTVEVRVVTATSSSRGFGVVGAATNLGGLNAIKCRIQLRGPSPSFTREESTALLALLVGGITLARAVHDEGFSKEIAQAVRKAAQQLANT